MANVSYSMDFFSQISLVLSGDGSESVDRVQKLFGALSKLELREAVRLCVRKRTQMVGEISNLWSEIHYMDLKMREQIDDFELMLKSDRYGIFDHFEVTIERSHLAATLDRMTDEIKAKLNAIERTRATVFMLDELINCQDESSFIL